MLVYDKVDNPFEAVISLNPYSIGCWSMTKFDEEQVTWDSLNPYSIGCWSMTC